MLNSIKKIVKLILYCPPSFIGKTDKFENLFKSIPDPWNFKNSAYEKKRYKILLNYVKKINPKNILEVGCAEGLFTEKLSEICGNVIAIELSETAIKKAIKTAPRVKFMQGDVMEIMPSLNNDFFDLVVAPEVLYYLKEKDARSFLKTIKTNNLLTSHSWVWAKKIEKIIKESGWKPRQDKRVNGFEDFTIKSSRVCLWVK